MNAENKKIVREKISNIIDKQIKENQNCIPQESLELKEPKNVVCKMFFEGTPNDLSLVVSQVINSLKPKRPNLQPHRFALTMMIEDLTSERSNQK